MRLYVLRHGQAEPYQTSDEARALTEKGLSDTLSLGSLFREKGLQIDFALVSPFTRTQQTFSQFQKGFGKTISNETTDRITPYGEVPDILDLLSGYEHVDNLLLVSHQPVVSSLTSALDTGASKNAYDYPMMPASVAMLETEVSQVGCYTLLNLLSPPYDH